MNLTTISEISRKMNISTRTMRYYEQIGLIESVKKEDYAYRTYDEETITLQRRLTLRLFILWRLLRMKASLGKKPFLVKVPNARRFEDGSFNLQIAPNLLIEQHQCDMSHSPSYWSS